MAKDSADIPAAFAVFGTGIIRLGLLGASAGGFYYRDRGHGRCASAGRGCRHSGASAGRGCRRGSASAGRGYRRGSASAGRGHGRSGTTAGGCWGSFTCAGSGRNCIGRVAFLIKARVESVKVLCIEIILRNTQRVAEALEMHDFTLAQELDRIADVRVVDQPKDIVVRKPGFLFSSEILIKI